MIPLVSLEKVSVRMMDGRHRAGRLILDDISLSLGARECIALLGPNGAGKTTLLRSLLGLVHHQGEVLLEGRTLRSMTRREIAQRIAYVPQALDRVPQLTVKEFVSFGRYCHGDTGERVLQHPSVLRALRDVDMVVLKDRCLSTLSGGERQRCLIAAALAQDPALLLLDEPTSFLDPGVREDILRTIARLPKEYGVTVVFVTHDINAAASHAGRVVALREGRVIFNGKPRALVSNHELGQIYSREFRLVTDPLCDVPLVVAGPLH